MSEDNSDGNITPISTTTETHTTRKTKKEEIFGFPKDDVTLALAGAGLGLAGLVGGKLLWDMVQNGQIPNPFQPANTRVTYSDIYDQQKQQQEWEVWHPGDKSIYQIQRPERARRDLCVWVQESPQDHMD